jgi:hypothetical protein
VLQSCQIQDGNVLRKIKDEDLCFFRDLNRIKTFAVTNTDISDEGLHHLVNLKELKHLNLDNSLITGIGINYLAELKAVETIWLRNTLLIDANLKIFKSFPKLSTLLIHNSKVTHNGLLSLVDLTHLRITEGGNFKKEHIIEFKKRQIEFTMNGDVLDEQLKNKISELISDFMTQITEIEENLQQLDEKDGFEQLKIEQYKRFNSVFDLLCDDRAARRYTAYGCTFQYFTYKDFQPLNFHQVTKSTIYAYYSDYSTVRFELVLKNGNWKILSLQRSFDKKWKKIQL